MPNSLLRLGMATALSRLGYVLHQSASFDPMECRPLLLVVEPVHLPECALLYPGIPTLTVSLFESPVAATPATSPEDMLAQARKLLSLVSVPGLLTTRERQILDLIATGSTTAEIAQECFVSREAVKTHIKRIYTKLGVHSRASAVTSATRQGILSL
jgi:DNA-binding CsgD family transcriptional regulator